MLTSTQFIRRAAMLTGQTEIKPGKVLTYRDPPLEAVPDPICWLCGGKTEGLGLPKKKRILDTFTDHAWARGQGSESLCAGCSFCLSMRELRNYSIFATEKGLLHPGRAEWREILLNPPDPPFVACLAVSGQKHLSFKAPMNYSNDTFFVLLEEQAVEVQPPKLEYILDLVEQLYAYFTKDEIATGNYSQHRIQRCGVSRWDEMETALSPWRRRRLFDLALFVAQKREAEEQSREIRPREVIAYEKPKTVTGNNRTDPGTAQIGFNW